MTTLFQRTKAEPAASPLLENALKGLDHTADERHVKSVLELLFLEPLPPGEHEATADRVRRLARMNRGTFKRILRRAQDSVQQSRNALT